MVDWWYEALRLALCIVGFALMDLGYRMYRRAYLERPGRGRE